MKRSKSGQWKLKNPIAERIHSTRYRAKKQRIPHTLCEEDVVKRIKKIDMKDEYTGEALTLKPNKSNSFSIDQKVAGRGYTKENFAICSRITNSQKGNKTPAQFKKYLKI